MCGTQKHLTKLNVTTSIYLESDLSTLKKKRV